MKGERRKYGARSEKGAASSHARCSFKVIAFGYGGLAPLPGPLLHSPQVFANSYDSSSHSMLLKSQIIHYNITRPLHAGRSHCA